MLPRARRVPTSFFTKNRERGRRGASSSFSYTYFSTSTTPSRFGVVLPKRVAHTAVERNKIKRRVYAILYKLLPTLPKNGILLIYPTKMALNISLEELVAEYRKELSLKG